MINSFDTDVAMKVGIVPAILYKNIQYWCEKNRANEMNEHDGLCWTYNSVKAYCEQFPYLTAKQIRKALGDLEEAGYIKTGNYNDDPRDRTKWYADASIINNIEVSDASDCNCPKGQAELPSKAETFAPEGEPLPNNYQITTTNKKEVSKKVNSGSNARAKEPSFDEILDSVDVIKDNPELREAFVNFIKMRKVIKAPLTNRGLALAINRAFEIAKGQPEKMIAVVDQSIERSWRGIFPITDSTIEPKLSRQQSVNPYTEMLKEEGYYD